jgi:hypothetical protein
MSYKRRNYNYETNAVVTITPMTILTSKDNDSLE